MPKSKNLIPNLAAFLDMLAFSEGTIKFGNDDGYNVIVGGSLFDSYKDHPKKSILIPKLKISSTAAGRYQLLARYYTAYKNTLNLQDFSPVSQDLIAIRQIKEQGALELIKNGQIKEAIEKCKNIWASLPGAGYGQHEHKLDNLISKYIEYGGTLNAS